MNRLYEAQEDIDRDLEAGRLDAALSSLGHWMPVIEEGADLVVIGPRMGGGPFGKGVGVVVRKDDGELAAMFSEAKGPPPRGAGVRRNCPSFAP